ncbi:cytochrome P450 [Paraphaeosphaeria sporulosa]|uniref:Cytochrome P450 n=1 Tax=Paraphaeosphaeria sporulosa TaxID=1460663 RepID=A0A177CGP9_9PLEO|nr:cytochrome P450 [Paraphaeosphaeria sporulosa]OAG05877.1 cytochrome P450 [Paraphaeosphaeria sporulosa]
MLSTLILSLIASGVLYYIISAFYCVTFHPLASVPGPPLCAFSRIPYWYVSFGGVDVFWMKRLHDKYGPVVRFGPTDLSYASAEGWQEVHGAKVQEKAVEFSPQPVNGVPPVLTATHPNHTRVRRLFSPAFSARSLKAQEPLFQKYADLLKHKVSEVGQDGQKPVDIGALLNFTTFDVMAELTFGQNLGMLAKTEYSPWVASIVESLKMLPLVAMINYYPLLRVTLFERFQPKWIAEQREAHCAFSADLVNRRLKVGSKKPDVWNLVLDDKGKGLTLEEMHSNAELFMLAGSETTATLLSGAIYNLLRSPRCFAKLVDEVRNAFDSDGKMTLENLGSLKYLNACLKEALRIYPPVPIGSPRIIQQGGQMILGTWVPPETRVSVHHWSTYHSSSNFTDPNSYVPERWLGDPKYAGDAFSAHQPFGSGYRNCIGQNMAMHEMRLIMATLLVGFDLELCAESEGWDEQKSFALWIKDPLMIRARPRSRGRGDKL